MFLAAFAVYTAVAVFLLALGLLAAAAVDPSVRATLQSWAASGGLLAPVWRNMANAARFAETPPEIAVDYILSAINIGVGAFLVWKRPHDRVAYLFGLGMVGVAMGFNFQSHAIVAIASGNAAAGAIPDTFWMQTAHFVFHAISGAAYLTALVLFPNGRFVPRWTKWLVIVLWGLTAEEVFFTLASLIVGGPPGARGFGEALIPFLFHQLFGVAPIANYSALVSSEVVYFTITFGLVIPVVGLSSQLYRYRRSTPTERAQTRLVVWALSIAFSVGIIVMALDLISFALRGEVFTAESSRLLYSLLLRLTPPLFVVLPVAIALAMLRYRLFDMTIVLDRTMIYGPLTAAIALVFLGTIFLLQQLLRTLVGGPSELAVALAALVNVFLFQPIRRRVQRFVDARLAFGDRRVPAPEPSS
ncbi:MAG: hypothetical protein HY071_00345 [Chloroflexi bacterium]|nr:hypothetical protein [Chloroflexota bacterium]